MVYSQRITVPQTPQTPKPTPDQSNTPPQEPESKASSEDAKPETDAKPSPGIAEKAEGAVSEDEDTAEPEDIQYVYVWKGRIDPFMPWYEDETSSAKEDANKRGPLSPLQKVDLSQLKLVGIVLSPSGNKALVEDGTGKGFVIMKGTYVGLNRGKVAKILRDRVIVQEATQYGDTDSAVRKKELKLQKPPGEE